MNVLLVSPKTPATFWSFKHALKFVSRRAAFPPLGLLTIAAFLPRSWNLKLVDLNVSRLRDRDLRWADYVMISAMIIHRESVREVLQRASRLGLPIVGGGPLFTSGSAEFAEAVHCVLGEAEGLMETIVRDMECGTLRARYGPPGRPDIATVPLPRWDLIKLSHYATMPVQFSRGCPFDCEFCDIVIMNGRRPRTKSPAQMLAEFEALIERNWRGPIFVVDDNFIGNKARVKEFLRELIDWQKRRGVTLDLLTEASINLAEDPELLNLMVRAGFGKVFVGIETPHPAGLEECHKVQNTRRDLAESVRTIQRGGLEVMGGFIVGFDSDPDTIFDLQFEFIQRSGIVTAMVGLLTALPETKLYQRLAEAGRLLGESSGNNTQAALNFVPVLDRAYLTEGYCQLMNALYEPKTYYQRVLTFLHQHWSPPTRGRITWRELMAFFKSVWLMGFWHPGRAAYWKFLATVLLRFPHKLRPAVALAVWGCHFRLVAKAL